MEASNRYRFEIIILKLNIEFNCCLTRMNLTTIDSVNASNIKFNFQLVVGICTLQITCLCPDTSPFREFSVHDNK